MNRMESWIDKSLLRQKSLLAVGCAWMAALGCLQGADGAVYLASREGMEMGAYEVKGMVQGRLQSSPMHAAWGMEKEVGRMAAALGGGVHLTAGEWATVVGSDGWVRAFRWWAPSRQWWESQGAVSYGGRLPGAVSAALAGEHLVALTRDGRFWHWLGGKRGFVAVKTAVSVVTIEPVEGACVLIHENGAASIWHGPFSGVQPLLSGEKPVRQVVQRGGERFVLFRDGEVGRLLGAGDWEVLPDLAGVVKLVGNEDGLAVLGADGSVRWVAAAGGGVVEWMAEGGVVDLSLSGDGQNGGNLGVLDAKGEATFYQVQGAAVSKQGQKVRNVKALPRAGKNAGAQLITLDYGWDFDEVVQRGGKEVRGFVLRKAALTLAEAQSQRVDGDDVRDVWVESVQVVGRDRRHFKVGPLEGVRHLRTMVEELRMDVAFQPRSLGLKKAELRVRYRLGKRPDQVKVLRHPLVGRGVRSELPNLDALPAAVEVNYAGRGVLMEQALIWSVQHWVQLRGEDPVVQVEAFADLDAVQVGESFVGRVRAVNGRGRAAEREIEFHLVDRHGPRVVSGPSGRIEVAANHPDGAVVVFDPVVAEDPSGLRSVTYSHESGSVFPAGLTQVTVTLEDEQGQVRVHAFEVMVKRGRLHFTGAGNQALAMVGFGAPVDAEVLRLGGEGVTVDQRSAAVRVTLKNGGPLTVEGLSALTVTGVVGDEFAVEGVDFPFTIQPYEQKQVDVVFRPSQVGVRTGGVGFQIGETGETVTLLCLGIGLENVPPQMIFDEGEEIVLERETEEGAALSLLYQIVDAGNVEPHEVVFDPPLGTVLAVGEHNLNYTVTDAGGLSVSGTVLVRVTDTVGPVIGLEREVVEVALTGEAGGVASWEPPLVTDPSGVDEVMVSHESGALFPPGVTVVTVTARDLPGNVSEKKFAVVVREPRPLLQAAVGDSWRTLQGMSWISGSGVTGVTGLPSYVRVVTGARSVSTSASRQALMDDRGDVWVSGSSGFIRVKRPWADGDVKSLAYLGSFLLALSEDGRVAGFSGLTNPFLPGSSGGIGSWGEHFAGQMLVKLVGSESHALGLRADGRVSVLSWADGAHVVVPPSLKRVVDVAAGNQVSFALLESGKWVSWGQGVVEPSSSGDPLQPSPYGPYGALRSNLYVPAAVQAGVSGIRAAGAAALFMDGPVILEGQRWQRYWNTGLPVTMSEIPLAAVREAAVGRDSFGLVDFDGRLHEWKVTGYMNSFGVSQVPFRWPGVAALEGVRDPLWLGMEAGPGGAATLVVHQAGQLRSYPGGWIPNEVGVVARAGLRLVNPGPGAVQGLAAELGAVPVPWRLRLADALPTELMEGEAVELEVLCEVDPQLLAELGEAGLPAVNGFAGALSIKTFGAADPLLTLPLVYEKAGVPRVTVRAIPVGSVFPATGVGHAVVHGFTLANGSGAALTGLRVLIEGGDGVFELESESVGRLNKGESFMVLVAFRPRYHGEVRAMLRVVSDDYPGVSLGAYEVVGRGEALRFFRLAEDDVEVPFDGLVPADLVGGERLLRLRVVNVGERAIANMSLDWSGSLVPVVVDGFPSSLAVAGSADFTVRLGVGFKPGEQLLLRVLLHGGQDRVVLRIAEPAAAWPSVLEAKKPEYSSYDSGVSLVETRKELRNLWQVGGVYDGNGKKWTGQPIFSTHGGMAWAEVGADGLTRLNHAGSGTGSLPPSLKRVRQMVGGYAHAVFLFEDGSTLVSGDEERGVLKEPFALEREGWRDRGGWFNFGFGSVSMSTGGLMSWSGLSSGFSGSSSAFSNYEFQASPMSGPVGAVAEGDAELMVAPSAAESTPTAPVGVVQVAAGGGQSLFLLESGEVMSRGKVWNGKRRVAAEVPPAMDGVVEIAAGAAHGVALLADGSVRAWGWMGRRSGGRMKVVRAWVPENLGRVVAVAAGWWDGVALCEDGRVMVWGGELGGTRDAVPLLASGSGAAKVRAGSKAIGAIMDDGTLRLWGTRAGADGEERIAPVALAGCWDLALNGRVAAVVCDRPPFLFDPVHVGGQGRVALGGTGWGGWTLPEAISEVRVEGQDAGSFSLSVGRAADFNGKTPRILTFHPQTGGWKQAEVVFVSESGGGFEYRVAVAGRGHERGYPLGAVGAAFRAGPLRVDLRSGDVVQRVLFRNTWGVTLPGLAVRVEGLGSSRHVLGGQWSPQGDAVWVQYGRPIGVGEEIEMDLKYRDPKKRTAARFQPQLFAEWVPEALPLPELGAGELVRLIGVKPSVTGSVLRFSSRAGELYRVEYSDDGGLTWAGAVHLVGGRAKSTVWVDRGPPETQTRPGVGGSRQYRVRAAW